MTLKTINMRTYYPKEYMQDCFVEVPEEIARTLEETRKYMANLSRYDRGAGLVFLEDTFESELTNLVPSVEKIIEHQALREKLLQSIKKLPPAARRRIVGYYLCDMSVAELAEKEGTSIFAIYKSLTRAKEKLKEYMESDD